MNNIIIIFICAFIVAILDSILGIEIPFFKSILHTLYTAIYGIIVWELYVKKDQ
jgi:hypothetical protein